MSPQFDPERTVRYAGTQGSYKPTIMFVKDIDVLIDDKPKKGQQPVIGLQVNPKAGASFIVPLAYESAKEVAFTILQTLMFAAPELLFSAKNREDGIAEMLEQIQDLL